MSYSPTGKVGAVVRHMSADPLRWFARDELSPVLCCRPDQVGAYLGAALKHQAMHRRKVAGKLEYRIAPPDPADPEADPPPAFNAALWADGDLILTGCQMGDAPGTVFLSPANVQTILRLCIHGAGQRVIEA